MRIFSIGALLLIANTAAFGQVKVRLNYNEYWLVRPSSEPTYYYRDCTVDTVHGGFIGKVKDYYRSTRTLQMTGSYDNFTKNGKFIFYFSNGKKKSEGYFTNGRKTGVWEVFYFDGGLRRRVKFTPGEKEEVLTCYDRTGKETKCEEYTMLCWFDDVIKENFVETYDNTDLTSLKEYPFLKKFKENYYLKIIHDLKNDPRDDQATYVMVEQVSQPLCGVDAFLQHIQASRVYPQEARRKKVEGGVTVDFVVSFDGTLTDIKCIKDIGSGCGDEVVRLLKSEPPWRPARHRGKLVRHRVITSVRFELD